MDPTPGRLLVATPALLDPNFWRTVILVIHGGADGHIGLILNRPTMEPLRSHLDDWAEHVVGDGLVHFGGPVEPDIAVSLISGNDGEPTGLVDVVIGDIESPPTGRVTARVFAGYSGWGPGQLEDEIAEGAWFVVEARPEDPFAEPARLWETVLRREGGRLALLSTFPIDVAMN